MQFFFDISEELLLEIHCCKVRVSSSSTFYSTIKLSKTPVIPTPAIIPRFCHQLQNKTKLPLTYDFCVCVSLECELLEGRKIFIHFSIPSGYANTSRTHLYHSGEHSGKLLVSYIWGDYIVLIYIRTVFRVKTILYNFCEIFCCHMN